MKNVWTWARKQRWRPSGTPKSLIRFLGTIHTKLITQHGLAEWQKDPHDSKKIGNRNCFAIILHSPVGSFYYIFAVCFGILPLFLFFLHTVFRIQYTCDRNSHIKAINFFCRTGWRRTSWCWSPSWTPPVSSRLANSIWS